MTTLPFLNGIGKTKSFDLPMTLRNGANMIILVVLWVGQVLTIPKKKAHFKNSWVSSTNCWVISETKGDTLATLQFPHQWLAHLVRKTIERPMH